MCAGTRLKCLQTGSSCEGEVRLKTALREGEAEGKSLKIKQALVWLLHPNLTISQVSVWNPSSEILFDACLLLIRVWVTGQPLQWGGLGHLPPLYSLNYSGRHSRRKIGAVINISWMCLRVHVAQTTPSVASPADVWSTLLHCAQVLNSWTPQLNTGGAPNRCIFTPAVFTAQAWLW